jgi:hypothetical protein
MVRQINWFVMSCVHVLVMHSELNLMHQITFSIFILEPSCLAIMQLSKIKALVWNTTAPCEAYWWHIHYVSELALENLHHDWVPSLYCHLDVVNLVPMTCKVSIFWTKYLVWNIYFLGAHLIVKTRCTLKFSYTSIVTNMASYAISSSLILVIHDNMIIGTNHIALACLCRHF